MPMWVVLAASLVLSPLPPRAVEYLPVLRSVVEAAWPDLPDRALLAGQIEQETCISLTHPSCWNSRAELHTAREYGFGLGQITITSRFNTFDTVKGLDPALRGWAWADRYDPARQIRALVALDRNLYRRFAPEDDGLAFMLSAYNGGLGGVLQDRRLCAAKTGCDPHRWFGHVERTSYRATTKVQGYGQSFFAINRGYVRNIYQRKIKYEAALHA